MITASLVKELREKTGAGIMDCKKVLVETDGDMEKSMELLRERGITKAAKKSGRIAAEGVVNAYVSEDKKVGAIVEVNAETDFVAKNDEFVKFVNDVSEIIAKTNPKDVDDLLAKPYLDSGKTVQEVLTDKIYVIGENMSIRRFKRFESTGLIQSYIHLGGKIGVLVDFAKGDETLAKDVCMQIAAARPEFIDEKSVPQDRISEEMRVLKAQVMNEGKPEAIAEKIVQGRIGKFYSEICLLDQEFVKDNTVKVGNLLKEKGAEITEFVRFETGEGLEKREENFADEVMKQLKLYN